LLAGYQESELRYLTFLYTCPLTVLYAAEQAGIRGDPVESVSRLTLHLVGARIAEIRHLVGWEIIALRLPQLQVKKKAKFFVIKKVFHLKFIVNIYLYM
jgi:hypothetical protein